MFQRIQSIFLICAAALISVVIFLDFASITNNEIEYCTLKIYGIYFDIDGKFIIKPLMTLIILCGVTLLSMWTTVFLYKKRMLQMRICGFNICLLAGIIVLMIYCGLQVTKTLGMNITFSITMVHPFIAIVLNILAMRAIWKDEQLIRSYERIR
jgi:hypothetical protein